MADKWYNSDFANLIAVGVLLLGIGSCAHQCSKADYYDGLNNTNIQIEQYKTDQQFELEKSRIERNCPAGLEKTTTK